MLLTATVTNEEDLPDAAAIVDSLATSARVAVRPVNGSQDSAFAAALPIGVLPTEHSQIAQSTREML